MKDIILFLLFLLIGLGLIIGYFLLRQKPNLGSLQSILPISTPTPTKTNFSLENAPSDSIKGSIATLSGDVSWQSRTATEAATIKNPITVQQGEDLETGKDGKAVLEFSGQVQIKISSNSKLSIVQTLPVNLVFAQSQGAVEYIKTGTDTVSVRSQNLLINIDDGDVMITLDPVRPFIYVNTIKGSATLAFNNTQVITKISDVAEGKQGVYNYSTRRLTIRNIPR